jgi:uncharacterized protein (TIGR03083 family)
VSHVTDQSEPPVKARRPHLFGRRGRAARREIDAEVSVDVDLDFSECLEGIRGALAGFVSCARKVGLDATVPTAAEWTVSQLVAHQGMVQRWATANVRGKAPDVAAYEAEGLDAADPVTWLHDGGLRLIKALQEAPEDLEAMVFLNDAPPPRQFWARRQCHETTIHSVDALAASLGRSPRASETEITREIALDGIDELLSGFLTRDRSTLRSEQPIRFSLRATDAERSWMVHVSNEPAVVEHDVQGHADVVLEASAEALYLALWNRTDEVTAEGYQTWRDLARVTWA